MNSSLILLAGALARPRSSRVDPSRHPMTRTERRWYREQRSLAASFGNPDAARLATLRVFDVDLLEHREVTGG